MTDKQIAALIAPLEKHDDSIADIPYLIKSQFCRLIAAYNATPRILEQVKDIPDTWLHEHEQVKQLLTESQSENEELANQLLHICDILNAKPNEDLNEDELQNGPDSFASACIRKIRKIIPNGDDLGFMILNTQYGKKLELSESDAHRLGKQLYARLAVRNKF